MSLDDHQPPITFADLPIKEQWFALDMVAVAKSKHPLGDDMAVSDAAEGLMREFDACDRPGPEECRNIYSKLSGPYGLWARVQKAAEAHVRATMT